jgi:hypothetical protein
MPAMTKLPRFSWAALAALALLACGDGPRPAPAGTPGGDAPRDTPDPGPAPGGGGTGGGGTPDPGTAGTPGGGGTTGGGGSGGGGTTDPGTAGGGGGGTAGGGTGGGGAGGGGTSGAVTCADLVPSFGRSLTVPFDTGTHSACDRAEGHPAGRVALGIRRGDGLVDYQLYRVQPDGVVADGTILHVSTLGGSQTFFPTSSGWQGVVHDGTPPLLLRTWTLSGARLADDARLAVATAPTAEGGAVLVASDFRPGAVGPSYLEWVDAAGTVTRSVALDRAGSLVMQVWDTGKVLVVARGSASWSARWFGADGAALGAWTEVAGVATPTDPGVTANAQLKLLVDRRVALYDGARWVAVFPDGDATAAAPPSWLAARAGQRLATIRQGRGYAAIGGASRFEVLTGAGESCGFFDAPTATPPAGQTWSPVSLHVGQDGTVFEVDNRFGGGLDPSIHCAFRFWPAALR